jgi:uncharacterized membrane-anchored protein
MKKPTNRIIQNSLSKVPEVTLAFWIIKIAATTLGETGGDAVSMSMHFDYPIASAIFIGIYRGCCRADDGEVISPVPVLGRDHRDHNSRHDDGGFCRSLLGIGYAGGSSILFVLLMMSLAVWYWSAGSVSIDTVTSPKAETFYWATILFSQTLGTALGDWMADKTGIGLGYEGGALVFAASLALVAAGYFYTNISPTLLCWSAFILTRPLGATVGDLLDKPHANGGLALSRFYASAILAAFIVCPR